MTVQQSQIRLRALGYDPGAADGAVGAKTTTALKKFQADRKLAVTGRLDPETVAALNANPAVVPPAPEREEIPAKTVTPEAVEAADWTRAADKDTPATYWEFSEKYPQSDRVRVIRGPVELRFAYVNAGNGMEARASVLVDGKSYLVSSNQTREWGFFRYEHVGQYLIPTSGGGIADGTVVLAKTSAGDWKISDIQGEVKGGGRDPVSPSLQSGSGSFRAGRLEWQLERAPRVMTWEEAKVYCANLAAEGGGWRLPSSEELESLYAAKSSIPGMDSYFGAVSSLGMGRYWSASAIGAKYAKEFDFGFGKSNDDAVGYRYNVRCAR
jgi:peptidoglycan hydrolase-like protein with peptidoglycan-binding domain